MVELPARDGDHPIWFEVLEILAEGLDRVEVVLAERERTCRRRRPRIHQGHLHHIKMLWARTQKRSAVGNMNVHLRTFVEMLRVIGVPPPQHLAPNPGIDLYPRPPR